MEKNQKISKTNFLLVEFDFLINIDLAAILLIKNKYNNFDLINQNIINKKYDEIIKLLLYRENENPLSIIFNNNESNELYNELLNDHMNELLKYSYAYDTFGLFVTYSKLLPNVEITVLCNSELESNYIKNLNNILNTKIVSKTEDLDISKYDTIYINKYSNIVKYKNLEGKHIYIANARYNMDSDKKNMPNLSISSLVCDVNIVHTIDLYKNYKYDYRKEDM